MQDQDLKNLIRDPFKDEYKKAAHQSAEVKRFKLNYARIGLALYGALTVAGLAALAMPALPILHVVVTTFLMPASIMGVMMSTVSDFVADRKAAQMLDADMASGKLARRYKDEVLPHLKASMVSEQAALETRRSEVSVLAEKLEADFNNAVKPASSLSKLRVFAHKLHL